MLLKDLGLVQWKDEVKVPDLDAEHEDIYLQISDNNESLAQGDKKVHVILSKGSA
jgi:hypothetical protein